MTPLDSSIDPPDRVPFSWTRGVAPSSRARTAADSPAIPAPAMRSVPPDNAFRLLARDHAAPESTLALTKAVQPWLRASAAAGLVLATQKLVDAANRLLPVFAAHALWRPRERAWIGRAMESRDVERLREDLELGVRLAESLGLDVSGVELRIP